MPALRACLEAVLWMREWEIPGFQEAIFELHSGATERKNGEMRFQKPPFAPKGPLGAAHNRQLLNSYPIDK